MFRKNGSGKFNFPLEVLPLLAGGLSSWGQYYPMCDPWHTFFAVSSFLPVIPFAVYLLLPNLKGRTLLTFAAIVPLLWIGGSIRLPLATLKIAGATETLDAPIFRGMKFTKKIADQWRPLISNILAIQKQIGQTPIVVEGWDGLFPTLSEDHRKPHPIFVTWTPLLGSELDADGMNFVRTTRALVITQWDLPKEKLDFFQNELHYRKVLVFEDTLRQGATWGLWAPTL